MNLAYKKLIFVGSLLLIIWITYAGYMSTKFHIVSTNPSKSSVATISPFIKVNFNRTLSKTGLSVSSSPTIIKSYSIDGKILTVNLNPPLAAATKYTITIHNILDTSNEPLVNKVVAFKPKVIAAQDLPKDQAAVLLQQQTYHPASRNNINFTGINSLVEHGVSLSQIDDFKQAIFQYSRTAKSVTVDPLSVTPIPHNAESDSTYDSINFNLKIDNKAFHGRVDYTNLVTLRLYLYDASSNSVVFDSGNITLGS